MGIPCHIYAELLFSNLVNVVRRYKCDCIALSGGVDTTAVLLATKSVGLKPKGYTALYSAGLPKDLAYVNYVSKALNIDVEYVYIRPEDVDILRSKVIECIGLDRIDSHNDKGCIEIRNDIVFYATLSKAKNDQCNCIYTGSGGDEIFAGYGFMLNLTEDKLENMVNRMMYGRYPEIEIAKCIGIKAIAPFLDEVVIEIAREIPLQCLRSERMLGKEVLRYILSKNGLYAVSERVKTPAESGAGTIDICRSVYDI